MCTHDFKYSKWLNNSICPIDGTLTGATTQGLSTPGSNSNKELVYIPQSSRTATSPSDGLVSYDGYLLREAKIDR